MIFGKHINKYYLKYSGMLLLGILTLLAVDILQLKIPELYRIVINGIEYGEVELNGAVRPFDIELLLQEICLPLLIITPIMVVGRFLWRVCFFGSAIRMETDMRCEMFDVARGLSREFYQRNKVGNLMSLFTNDLETLHECFGSGVLMLFDALLLGVLAITKMVMMTPVLTLLSLIPMALLLVTGLLLGRVMRERWRARQEAYSSLSDFAQENFSGIAVIKAFVKEFRELWCFRKLNEKNEKVNIDFTRASVLLRVLTTLFVESVVCIILGYGGYLVWSGDWGVGQMFEFISYFTSIVWPVMAVSSLIEMSSRGKASLGRISEFLDTLPDVIDSDDVRALESPRGEIEFCNLSFTYPGSEIPALEDVSLHVMPGERIGIIGRTGSGKTTLVDLLLRSYNVPRGTVKLDGVDVNDLSIRSVRDAISYVPQDNFLFSDTIAANIGFAVDGEVDRKKIERAAALADVHGNISEFGDGYDTVLGERGVTVSGGQKQRISIARALMKESAILILDDSVSAVDTATEEVIIRNLAQSVGDRTLLLIAHRVSTVEEMDRIVFLDGGRILDVGTHAQLMERCAAYRETVELQRLEGGGLDE